MTITHYMMRTSAFAAAMALSAAVAVAQTSAPPSEHEHGGRPHATPQIDVAARMALLDARIAMLTADVKMFTGDLKIQAMAEIIEAMVERQTLMDRRMREMHEMMRHRMTEEMMAPVSPAEMEPDTMCSPFI